MDKLKCPKTNLRNLKHINPNPKDSDQREIKSLEAEKDSDQRERKSWLVRLGLACGLGSCGLGSRGLGSRCLGRAWPGSAWVARGLGLPGSRTVV